MSSVDHISTSCHLSECTYRKHSCCCWTVLQSTHVYRTLRSWFI